ncbi:cytochrome P450 [Conidiobolus coronatus NRRL 28638]|uniref:Cytochrome P450 n=1 Tax=Conidiobolus coronatus (strain ATCC 28846 / CBS 209.66 / NRRL 28638) TaxID=796925 RepID=A0A137P6S6_CONC2|nr:cytochrome P450 [Conidiobolus coronatus NRRL 28638]|eukprot:KXN70706.1 cytochrome P450 [Conidiobolus coronatus NRRL 28638]
MLEYLTGIGIFGFIICGLLAYFYYAAILYPYYLGPLRNIPRPKNGFWHFINHIRNELTGNPNTYIELSLKYGPIVHLRDKLVLINNSDIRKCYINYKFPKAKVYELLSYNGPNLFSTTSREYHASRKKLILPAFNNKALVTMEPTIYRVGSESLVQYLNSCLDSETSKEFDFYNLFHCNTLDVISELVFGETLNTTWDEEKRIFYIEELSKTIYATLLRALVPFYTYFTHPMEKLFKPMIMENIGKRRKLTEVNDDILQCMIDAEDPETGVKLTDSEIVDECLVLLFAGMDTTANALTWTIYELLRNPEVYELVAKEVLEKFPNLNEPISVDIAKNELKYLDSAITGAMRMHPPAAGILPREVPEGGLTIAGHYLPPKTEIAIDIYTQHNDPAFWENPRKFDIDRWLGPNAEFNKEKLFNWSTGPRSCIGRDLAKAEIYLVLTNLIRNFNFELIDKELTPMNISIYKPVERRFRVNVSRRS